VIGAIEVSGDTGEADIVCAAARVQALEISGVV